MEEPKPAGYAREDYSPRDHYTTPAPPPARAQPVYAEQARLSRLLWVLALLAVLLLGPMVVQRFQYAYTYGRERARVQAATEGLEELELTALGTASRLVAQKVGPSVVNIRTVQLLDRRNASDEWSFLLPRRAAQGQGSGVIIDEDGYIVTNSHVISGASQIAVQLSDGREVPARVVGADVLTDIAVLKIEADRLSAASWGESDQLEVGDMVWALGSPYGLERTVTFGIVSAKGRRGVTQRQSLYQEFLQTDAAVNPGNSGGPLVNIAGRVVGINTAIVGPAYQGISFAIPSAIAREVYLKLKETGQVARGWLGVELRELTPELARQLGLEVAAGVLVGGVIPDSPAMDAGLQPGDVIVAWDGQPTPTPLTLSRLVAGTEIGARVPVSIWREGEEMALEVRVGQRPD